MSGEKPKAKPSLGFLLLMVGLIIYAFVAAAVGDLIIHWPVWIQTVYYIIAGVGWIFPAKSLLVWSLRSAAGDP